MSRESIRSYSSYQALLEEDLSLSIAIRGFLVVFGKLYCFLYATQVNVVLVLFFLFRFARLLSRSLSTKQATTLPRTCDNGQTKLNFTSLSPDTLVLISVTKSLSFDAHTKRFAIRKYYFFLPAPIHCYGFWRHRFVMYISVDKNLKLE